MSKQQPKTTQAQQKPQPWWWMDKYNIKWNEAHDLIEYMKENNIKNTKHLLK